MRCLVTGASGLLGRAVVEKLKKDGHEVTGIGFTRSAAHIKKLDLTDFEAVDAFLQSLKPEVIIHSAAERRPDVVEKSPEASHALNVKVPVHLAQWCKAQNEACPLLINISTDYVFDGVSTPYKVDDEPNPLNAYGQSKWDGEKGVRENGKSGRSSSLRVPVLYGRTETNSESAVNVLLDALIILPDGKAKKMDANAVRYPTCVSDVAHAISLLCSKFGSRKDDIPPTLHFSAMEAMTKYDMCLVMARCLRAAGEEAHTDHLEPEYEVDPNAATSRPRHCKLDLSVIKGAGINFECVAFEAWWREYLQEYAKAASVQRRQEEERAAIAAAAKAKADAEAEATRRKEEEEADVARKEKEEREAEEERKEAERREQEERKRKEEMSSDEKSELTSTGAEKKQPNEHQGSNQQNGVADLPQEDDNQSQDRQMSPTSDKEGSLSGRNVTARPSSPNPSFSSLQARPTPPATSGRNSPSLSILSTNAVPIPGTVEEEERADQLMASASTSLTETGASIEKNIDPLLPTALQFPKSSTGEDKPRDEPGFFPSALVKSDGVASSLGIETAIISTKQSKASNGGAEGDADSDGYGQPSPRDVATNTPFAAGYGEVQYGLNNEGEVTTAQMDESRLQQIESLEANLPKSSISFSSPSTLKLKGRTKHTFQIRVGDPQKIGDPMTAHIVYTVRIKTDSPLFKSNHFSVLRRYSDFRWLHAALVYNNAGIFIPPVPEKVKIGRFAPDLVEARRHGLENCINKIANNVNLQIDDDFILFISSTQFQTDVKARDQVKGPVPTPEQKTIFGWSTSLTGTSYEYHESDPWFEEQIVYLDHLESQLKNLVRVIGMLSQQRKEVAASLSEFSHAIIMLSGSSLSRSLSTCFAGLGEVQRRMFELTDVQADFDIRDFGSVIYEYERMVGSARKAFNTRIDSWQVWQKYQEESRKIQLKHEKLKREVQGNSHRIHDARMTSILDEVASIESKCLNQKREFDWIGLRCKEEMNRFEWDRIHGFEEACEIWMQGMIERNQELMAEWEQYAALLERQTGEKIAINRK